MAYQEPELKRTSSVLKKKVKKVMKNIGKKGKPGKKSKPQLIAKVIDASIIAPEDKQNIAQVMDAMEENSRRASHNLVPVLWKQMKANFFDYCDDMERALKELMASGMDQYQKFAKSTWKKVLQKSGLRTAVPQLLFTWFATTNG